MAQDRLLSKKTPGYVTVAELIEQLKQCDPTAFVLYAHDEHGTTGIHHFISADNRVELDENGGLLEDEDGLQYMSEQDYEDGEEPRLQGAMSHPAIVLFPQ